MPRAFVYVRLIWNLSDRSGSMYGRYPHENTGISRKLSGNNFNTGAKKGNVRSIDIAHELEFKKPSVSVAMKNLRQNGFIEVDDSGFITLTASGRQIAESIYERHLLFSRWLTELGVNEKTAAEDACKMEHVLSTESFEAIKKHLHQFLNE